MLLLSSFQTLAFSVIATEDNSSTPKDNFVLVHQIRLVFPRLQHLLLLTLILNRQLQALAKTGDVSELEALSSKQKRLEFKRKIMDA
jgi:hypothetical protein